MEFLHLNATEKTKVTKTQLNDLILERLGFAPGLTSLRASSPSSAARSCAISGWRSKQELRERIMLGIKDVNRHPVVHTASYKLAEAAQYDSNQGNAELASTTLADYSRCCFPPICLLQ